MIKLKQILEEQIDLNTINTQLKQYFETDLWSNSSYVSLPEIFSNLDINYLRKTYPQIFVLPSNYTIPNMYFYRGYSLSIDEIKRFGAFTTIETIDGQKWLSSYDRKIKFNGIMPFTAFPKIAIGFATNSAGIYHQNDIRDFNASINNQIPTIIAVEYSKYKNNFFGNSEYFAKISKHGNEGEVFYKGGDFIADILIPQWAKKYLK